MHFGMNSYPFPEYRLQHDSKLAVQGEGIIKVKPDVVSLTIGVMTENENVKAAQEENATRTNALLAALKNLQIEDSDIRTLSYTITPIQEYVDGKPHLRGYRVEHLYDINVLNVQKAGEVYEAALQAGANIARNLSFRVSNAHMYYKQALTQAIHHAQEKARIVGNTLGVTMNLVPVSIKEEQTVSPHESIAYESFAKTVPPIQPGEQNIIVTISALFSYI
ncbi:SIMPL domain-containing protein [Microbacteriaceae bacterium 4G12]